MKTVATSTLAFLLAFACLADEENTARAKATELTQKGIDHFTSLEGDDWPTEAVDYYDYAILVDPMYGPAYANLAIAEHAMWTTGREPREVAEKKAKQALSKAKELAPQLSTTYSADGLLKYKFDNDFDGAFVSLNKAIELDPKNTGALLEYGWALLLSGQLDPALEKAKEAYDMNPNAHTISALLAHIYRFKCDTDKAVEAWRHLSPGTPHYYGSIATEYLNGNQYDKAIKYAQKGLAYFPNNNWLKNLKGWAEIGKGEYETSLATFGSASNQVGIAVSYAFTDRKDEARKILETLKNSENQGMWHHLSLASINLSLGDTEQALASLAEANKAASSDYYVFYTFTSIVQPSDFFAPLRSDERFLKILEKSEAPPEPAQR